MENKVDDLEIRKRMQPLENLLQEVANYSDPAAREHTREIVQVILDFHGVGLSRILEIISKDGEAGQPIVEAIGQDQLASSLLLLYGLHPLEAETRIQQALEHVGPTLRSHGGNVDYIGYSEGTVHVLMQRSGHSCPSTALTLKQLIEDAIFEAAPEVNGIEIEGISEESAQGIATFVPVGELLIRNGLGGTRQPEGANS